MTGTAPLLCNNVRKANPLDEYARAMKEITSKKDKTDADHADLARLDFEGGLYIVPGVGPYLPGPNIERCIVDGGSISRKGPSVKRGLFVIDDEAQLIYDGPRDIEGLWEKGFWWTTSARPQRATVQRTRPRFNEWAVEVFGELDPNVLSLVNLRSYLTTAGAMVGIGDYRPRYGRFVATVEEA
jgi:hypothetical protein